MSDVAPPEASLPAAAPAPWGLGGSAAVVFLSLASQLVLALLLTGFAGLVLSASSPDLADKPEELSEAATQVSILPLALASSLVTLGLVYASVVVHHRRPFFKSLGLSRPSTRGLLASAACGWGLACAGVGLMMLIPFEGDSESLGPLTRLADSGPIGRAIWLALGLCLAPLVEEILFRGYAYLGARRRLGAFGSGLAVTCLFLLLHLGETGLYWPALAGIGMLAAVLAMLMERTGNLSYCIACHLGYNATLASAALLGG